MIGVEKNGQAKAYDWNDLVKQRVINDTFQNTSIALVVENDNKSFHVWNRQVNDKVLQFEWYWDNGEQKFIRDTATYSVWNMQGQCIEGALKGSRLSFVQAYQEFWHSWQTFHPATKKYTTENK